MRLLVFLLAIFSVAFYQGLPASPYREPSCDEWMSISKHLLEESHPAKGPLDRIFAGERDAVYSKERLLELGFLPAGRGGHVWAMRHPDIEGYLVKFYRRHVPGYRAPGSDWEMWLRRIEGANLIRKEIKRGRFTSCLTVAKKWIYPLAPQEGEEAVNFLLVVEDLECVTAEKNKEYYGRKMTKLHLKLIYRIVTKHGFADGCSHNNLIWTKEGQLAFVDTETFHRWPVRYHSMLEYLNRDMRKWWNRYVKGQGEDPGK